MSFLLYYHPERVKASSVWHRHTPSVAPLPPQQSIKTHINTEKLPVDVLSSRRERIRRLNGCFSYYLILTT